MDNVSDYLYCCNLHEIGTDNALKKNSMPTFNYAKLFWLGIL